MTRQIAPLQHLLRTGERKGGPKSQRPLLTSVCHSPPVPCIAHCCDVPCAGRMQGRKGDMGLRGSRRTQATRRRGKPPFGSALHRCK